MISIISFIRHFKFKVHTIRTNLKRSRDKLLGNKNYKKFVIISDSRTGSTLLQNLLNFHEQMEVEGEKFRIVGASSLKIWNHIFSPKLGKVEYVGFKLFYQHPIKGDNLVWDFVENDDKIIIIHLQRRNILRSLVSKKIGLKTKMWTENIFSKKDIPLEEKQITLTKNECEEYFEKILNYQKDINKRFPDHQIVDIYYEDLAEDRNKVLCDIQKRFKLAAFNKDSQLKKQNPESLKSLIINYEELKIDFAGTKWNKFFNE